MQAAWESRSKLDWINTSADSVWSGEREEQTEGTEREGEGEWEGRVKGTRDIFNGVGVWSSQACIITVPSSSRSSWTARASAEFSCLPFSRWKLLGFCSLDDFVNGKQQRFEWTFMSLLSVNNPDFIRGEFGTTGWNRASVESVCLCSLCTSSVTSS